MVVYRVSEVARPDNGLALGVDMNCGQVAASTGDLLRLPDMARLQARKRRYQRMAASRRSQSEFECVRCGHKGNADVNAALNIVASATGAAGRRGALALATPMNRQNVYERRAA